MAEKGNRIHRGEVLRTRWLTPGMIRVALGGPGLREFRSKGHTDEYIKLIFPAPNAPLPAQEEDLTEFRARLPRADWPHTRTYTVRAWDSQAGELTLDIFCHGSAGFGGPWAVGVRPGDSIAFIGPGGGYVPNADAPWHLLAGDESALPAIARALEAMPAGAVVRVFVEVDGPEAVHALPTSAQGQVVWLYRGERERGVPLVEAVAAMAFLPGEPQVFVHGEAGTVKRLRLHLRAERRLSGERFSVSGYWRQGIDEGGWQATKGEWNRQSGLEELDLAASRASSYLW